MLFTLLSRTLIAALAVAPLLVVADKSPQAPTSVYDGCKPTTAFLDRTLDMKSKYGKNSHGSDLVWWRDDGIQMAECFANMRVINHVYAAFVINPNKWKSEGAPYGSCIGFAVMPTAKELERDLTSNWSCGFWAGKEGGPVPEDITIPGKKFIPPAMVCPHNIGKCYSDKYYEPGGELAQLGGLKSTYTGRIYGPEDSSGKQLYCDCFNCGCKVPTLAEYATRSFSCSVSSCKRFSGGAASHTSGNKEDKSASNPLTNKITVGGDSGVNALNNKNGGKTSDMHGVYSSYSHVGVKYSKDGRETKVEYQSNSQADFKSDKSKKAGHNDDDDDPKESKDPKKKENKVKPKKSKQKRHVQNIRRSF